MTETGKKIAVVALIEQEEKVLLGKKIRKENTALSESWHVPGGKLEEGEDEKMGLIREMREELGADLEVEEFIGSGKSLHGNWLVKWYWCSLEGEPKPGSDLSEVRFVPKEEAVRLCREDIRERWPEEVKKYFKIL